MGKQEHVTNTQLRGVIRDLDRLAEDHESTARILRDETRMLSGYSLRTGDETGNPALVHYTYPGSLRETILQTSALSVERLRLIASLQQQLATLADSLEAVNKEARAAHPSPADIAAIHANQR